MGTGFSIGTPTASSEEEIAQDFLNFFGNFQQLFGISNFKIFMTGESYAGRYVPYIAGAMVDRNDTVNYDISGKSFLSSRRRKVRLGSQVHGSLWSHLTLSMTYECD